LDQSCARPLQIASRLLNGPAMRRSKPSRKPDWAESLSNSRWARLDGRGERKSKQLVEALPKGNAACEPLFPLRSPRARLRRPKDMLCTASFHRSTPARRSSEQDAGLFGRKRPESLLED
jgi:hypothetical protein